VLFTNLCISQQIITDRPDQTEASSTVPKGSLQMEMGFQVTFSEDFYSFRDIAAPNMLLRYGLTSGIELRAISEVVNSRKTRFGISETISGMADLALGAKIQLVKTEEKNTEIALLSHVILPSGTNIISDNSYGFENRFSISHNLGENSSVGYNLGYNNPGYGSGSAIYTIALGTAVGKKAGVYIEPFGEYFLDSEFLEASFDAGFTYLLQDNMQIDFSFGTGLSHSMNYMAVGFSWNIPAE